MCGVPHESVLGPLLYAIYTNRSNKYLQLHKNKASCTERKMKNRTHSHFSQTKLAKEQRSRQLTKTKKAQWTKTPIMNVNGYPTCLLWRTKRFGVFIAEDRTNAKKYRHNDNSRYYGTIDGGTSLQMGGAFIKCLKPSFGINNQKNL